MSVFYLFFPEKISHTNLYAVFFFNFFFTSFKSQLDIVLHVLLKVYNQLSPITRQLLTGRMRANMCFLLFDLLLMLHHRAAWHTWRKASLFLIYDLTDVHDYLVSFWLTGEWVWPVMSSRTLSPRWLWCCQDLGIRRTWNTPTFVVFWPLLFTILLAKHTYLLPKPWKVECFGGVSQHITW